MARHRSASLRSLCSLAATLALSACSADSASSPAAPTAPALSAASVALPFRGTLETRTTSVTPLGPGSVLARADGTGTATHLGRYAIVTATTVNFATLTSNSRYIMTAANGDALFVTVSARATRRADGVTFDVVESATITGGTGRFAGAAGAYQATCVVNQAAGTSTGWFEGTISFAR